MLNPPQLPASPPSAEMAAMIRVHLAEPVVSKSGTRTPPYGVELVCRSTETKKWAWSRTIGPPKVAPNCVVLNLSGTGCGVFETSELLE